MPKRACSTTTALIFLRTGLEMSTEKRSRAPFSGIGVVRYLDARPTFKGKARMMGYTAPPNTPISAPRIRAQVGQLRSPDSSGVVTVALYRAHVVRKGSTAIGRLEAKGACLIFRALRYKLLDTIPARPAFPPK